MVGGELSTGALKQNQNQKLPINVRWNAKKYGTFTPSVQGSMERRGVAKEKILVWN